MASPPPERLHILLLADRELTHPQTGGNGANIFNQVSRCGRGHWSPSSPGRIPAPLRSSASPTTSSSTGWAAARRSSRARSGRSCAGSGATPTSSARSSTASRLDAAVAAQAPGGAGPPQRAPRALHRRVRPTPRDARWRRCSRRPLRLLYRRTPFLTISRSARSTSSAPGSRWSTSPWIPRRGGRGLPPPPPLARAAAGLRGAAQGLAKRIEIILDVLEAIPGAQLDVAATATTARTSRRRSRAGGWASA